MILNQFHITWLITSGSTKTQTKPDDDRNATIRVPGREQSNQVGELLTILHAVRTALGDLPLKIRGDSKFLIDGLTKHARRWEEID